MYSTTGVLLFFLFAVITLTQRGFSRMASHFPRLDCRLRRPSAAAISLPRGRGSEVSRRIFWGWGAETSGRGRGISTAGGCCLPDMCRSVTWDFFDGTGFFVAGAGTFSGADCFGKEVTVPVPAAFCRSALGGRGTFGVASKISIGQGWSSTTGTFLPISFSISLR